MSERLLPPQEPLPTEINIRRDALLLRIVELREAVKKTNLDQEVVTKELDEIDRRVQHVEGILDMRLFEEMFETWERIVDSKK